VRVGWWDRTQKKNNKYKKKKETITMLPSCLLDKIVKEFINEKLILSLFK
jgi:hypothetical protein